MGRLLVLVPLLGMAWSFGMTQASDGKGGKGPKGFDNKGRECDGDRRGRQAWTLVLGSPRRRKQNRKVMVQVGAKPGGWAGACSGEARKAGGTCHLRGS